MCKGLACASGLLNASYPTGEVPEQELCTQVAELKQQIRVLQAVGFGAVEGDEAGSVGSLEVKLLGKLRGLEHALTMARLQEAQSAGTKLS